MGCVQGMDFFVGCDKRSESNGWCAGTGGFRVTGRQQSLKDLRAGTPPFSFSPLVTPYANDSQAMLDEWHKQWLLSLQPVGIFDDPHYSFEVASEVLNLSDIFTRRHLS